LLPIVGAAALTAKTSTPSFAEVLGRRDVRPRDRLALALGVLLVVLGVLAVQAALGLTFDPRYRDFPFAPLTRAGARLVLGSGEGLWGGFGRPRAPGGKPAMAATLAATAIYVVFNESFANWQALWFAAGLIALALTLLQARAAPG